MPIKDYAESAISFSIYYEKFVYQELKEKILKEILEVFKSNFMKYDSEYGLVTSNSVYSDILLYEFHPRVKNPKGLAEKLIRNNLIFGLKDNFYTEGFDNEENEELNKCFYQIDDIIGIKILTSLNFDCKNVRRLITEKRNDFDDIVFTIEEDSPTVMRNGRSIHKIKCCYKEIYCFELQIKSKIDSAWSDLEHNLFYKDYDFNYIKDNNQDIMNSVGSLLERIEVLMLSIRNSKKEFNDSYQRLSFKYKIAQGYKEYTVNNFKSLYLLEKNVDELYFIYTNDYGEFTDQSKVLQEEIEIPNYTDFETILSINYNNLKDKNFEISLIEIIYYNWKMAIEPGHDSECLIKGLIHGVLKYLLHKVSIALEKELSDEDIISNIENIIKREIISFKEANLLIDIDALVKYVLLYNEIDSIVDAIIDEERYYDYSDAIYDEDSLREFVVGIKSVIFVSIYSTASGELHDVDSIKLLGTARENIEKYNIKSEKVNKVIYSCIQTINFMMGVR